MDKLNTFKDSAKQMGYGDQEINDFLGTVNSIKPPETTIPQPVDNTGLQNEAVKSGYSQQEANTLESIIPQKKPISASRPAYTGPVTPQVIQKAEDDALQSGADPVTLANAKKYLGEAAYIGYCQSFVEKVSGSGWQGGSAIEAWQNTPNKVSGLQGIQPGDKVYFSPDASNSGYGHVGVYAGNNQFISATNNGIEKQDLSQWQQNTGQRVLGYVPVARAQVVQTPNTAPIPSVTLPPIQPVQAPQVKSTNNPISSITGSETEKGLIQLFNKMFYGKS